MSRVFHTISLSIWIAMVGMTITAHAQEATEPPALPGTPPVEQWWQLGGWDDDTLRRLDKWGDQIPTIVFNSLNDITLFQNDSDRIGVSLSAHRRIFENHDSEQSLTVADRFRVTGTIPLYSEVITGLGQAGRVLGFSIGSTFGVDFINIRRVVPDAYAALPSLEERRIQLEEEAWVKYFIEGKSGEMGQDDASAAQGQWVYEEGPEGQGLLNYLPIHPDSQIRYAKPWRIPLIPFKLPLHVEEVGAMENGEIISYVGFGSFQAGPSVGWDLDPSGLTPLSQEVMSYSTYVQGTYRISVLKESDQMVRLKVSRVSELGHAGTVGAGAKPTALEGMIIVKHFSSAIKIIPFNLRVSQTLAKSFDVSYRYNLALPDAREAYERAVRGKTALSDTLAIDAEGHPKDFEITGVEKLSIRNSLSENREISRQMRLGFIWRRESHTSFITVDSVITLPDGEHHIFNAVVENSWQWHVVFSFFEKFGYQFRVSVDLDRYQVDPHALDAVSLTVESNIQDSDTSPAEMLAYELEVEDALGKTGIFPRPPRTDSDIQRAWLDDLSLSLSNLGSSRFFYRMRFNHAQIEDFAQVDEGRMWGIVEHAFSVYPGNWSTELSRSVYQILSLPMTVLNVPLYVADVHFRSGSNLWHARQMVRRWKRLKHRIAIKDRAEALGKLFFDSLYSYELVRLLRSALDGREVGYWVSGYSPYFGQRWEQGDTTLAVENKASRLQREIDFDVPGLYPPDELAQSDVENLEVKSLGSDQISVSFDLKQVPQALFFQISLSNPWWIFSNGKLAHVLVYNRGLFKEGKNTFVWNKNDVASPWFPLIKDVAKGNRYTLQVSSNTSGISWGPLIETVFRVR